MTDKLLLGESVNVEYKEAVPEKSIKYMKTVVAFANGKGGTLVFGIEDGTMKVVGIDKEELFTTMDAITNAIMDSCEPMIVPNIYVRNIEDKYVLFVEIEAGKQTPYYIKSLGIEKGSFIRVGGTTRLAELYYVKDLILRGTNKFYDQLPAHEQSITEKEIEEFCVEAFEYAKSQCETAKERATIRPLTKNKLYEWKLLHDVDGKVVPSIGLCILLGKPLDGMDVKVQCAVFKGDTRAIFVDRKEYTGKLSEQIDEAYDFVLRAIHLGAKIEGIQRKDIYELPIDVIRELICNAICHRSYLEPVNVQVILFDDRLEITSPGMLMNEVSIERMKQGYSQVRNRGIANVLAYMKIIEGWGTGIPRMFKRCKEYGLPEPRIQDLDGAVRIDLYRDGYLGSPQSLPNRSPITPQLLPNEEVEVPKKFYFANDIVLSEQEVAVLDVIRENLVITQQEIATKLNVDRELIKYYVKRLRKNKVLDRQGNTRSGKWIVNEEILVEE